MAKITFAKKFFSRHGILPIGEMSDAEAGFLPIRVLDVEISQPLLAITASDSTSNTCYQAAWILVRLHDDPLGLIKIRLPEHGVSAEELSTVIWRELSQSVQAHLLMDGMPTISSLPCTGVESTDLPRCTAERTTLLADAPTITVVIPTKDRPEQLYACIRSILACAYPQTKVEVVVVDNAPTSDATFLLVLNINREFPCVRYIREPQPGGAAARNTGIRLAEGELVAFADDDVIVDNHWLAELARGFNLAPDVACVTGLILPLELETQAQVWLESYGGFGKGFATQIYNLTDHRPNDPLFPYTAGRFGSGANMAFRQSALQDSGAFSLKLGSATPTYGGEDIELLFRTIIQGRTLVYQPSAIVHHPHHREYIRLRKQIYGYGVGLSAYLCKAMVDDPRLLPDLISKLPTGIFYLLNPKSDLNHNKESDFPRELKLIELKGMAYGPVAYVRSSLRVRYSPMGGRTPRKSPTNTRIPMKSLETNAEAAVESGIAGPVAQGGIGTANRGV